MKQPQVTCKEKGATLLSAACNDSMKNPEFAAKERLQIHDENHQKY
jgi:hypothetical protein